MTSAALVACGGGPTHVMNASLAGIIGACRSHWPLYGAAYGNAGLIGDSLVDLSAQDPALVEAVGATPGAALGSSRRAARPEDYERILAVLRARDIRVLFYIGGNGTMYSAMRIAGAARDAGYELRVIGVPKTIDNDLPETDHSPGYGSAARFFACAARDIGGDLRDLPGRVTVLETMGRDTGWIVAATALARARPDDPPHLIYLPERRLSADRLLADVEAAYSRLGYAVVAVCEGQMDEKGEPFGADLMAPDGFERRLARNLGHVLAELIARRLGINARSEKPGLLGRSSAAFASAVDRAEARMCGVAAVEAAVRGESGVMVTLVREPGGPYRCRTGLAGLDSVANRERRFPDAWIDGAGNDVSPPFIEYAAPLAGEIEPRPRLDPAERRAPVR